MELIDNSDIEPIELTKNQFTNIPYHKSKY